uniref:Uncharacterized protein n=1 Tax=Arcella intermedia TaxID=1963864 RepID=A0A6B2LE45_9EUKA|eukprot:TRINITY_DN1794_c0_g1_i3.p1 TRINITY_DN1794_c0_g1~~TRINITY_DN1794_c0_g1_i3.p1  ORF type:complete len:161 (-),score=29.99 TRINITY_DN1794_c0_g1_i3:121-603(-)
MARKGSKPKITRTEFTFPQKRKYSEVDQDLDHDEQDDENEEDLEEFEFLPPKKLHTTEDLDSSQSESSWESGEASELAHPIITHLDDRSHIEESFILGKDIHTPLDALVSIAEYMYANEHESFHEATIQTSPVQNSDNRLKINCLVNPQEILVQPKYFFS